MLPLLLAATFAASDSTVYPVLNHDRPAGTMVVTRSGDSIRVRYVFTDRNRGTRLEMRYLMRGDDVVSVESRPVLPDERAGEPTIRLEFVGDSIRQITPARTSFAKAEPGVYYGLSFTPYDQVRFAKYLLRQKDHTGRLPYGVMRLAVINETTVPTRVGREKVRLVSLAVANANTPQLMWLDSHDDLFATEVSWFMTIKPGAEPALPTLRKIEAQFRETQADAVNRRLVKPANGTVAIRNGDLFDAERGVMQPNMTVIVRGDRIVAVGPAGSTAVPSDATVIDASGKTIMPGMWEMHNHMQTTSNTLGGPMQLSFGITTTRDLGSDPDVAVSVRDHADAGTIAAPRAILSGFIDGPGKWAGPTPFLVRTEDEARQLVAHFDSLHYKQIKLYNLVHPDLIPTFAAEAHKRGMRLSGHMPRGLSVADAVTLGFDEVNHAAFLFSTFYPDSLYVPTMRAYSLVATTVAPNIDVDGAPMTNLIALLKQHNTVIDGTFSVWITSGNTGIANSVGAGVSSDAQKSDANYLRLLKCLYDAGVTLVAGTDAFGSTSFNTELELYEKAGIPAATVMQIATIIPARVMKDDANFGSIAVGKVADLFIVNGRPAEHVSDVRKVEQVMRAGRIYDATELKLETGLIRK